MVDIGTRPNPKGGWRERWREIIFEADTPGGKAFDVALLILILVSVLAVMLDSVASIADRYGTALGAAEWALTILFTAEYFARLVVVTEPRRYALSFFGIVDLLALLPSYLALVLSGTHSLLVIRVLRLLRVFRVFKMARYLGEANVLAEAIRGSIRKITVFLGTVITIAVIVGTLMYMVEGEASGFSSIPRSVYWAIVTLTTVGYGDIAPATPLGQFIAAMLMLTGYGIIAVPTGIVTAEIVHATHHVASRVDQSERAAVGCKACGASEHARDAEYCARCGSILA